MKNMRLQRALHMLPGQIHTQDRPPPTTPNGRPALAVAGCAFFGIATGGVGLFIRGLGGGIAGSLLGSAVMGDLAREGGGPSDSTVCPSCHAMQRDWEQERSMSTFGDFPLDFHLLPADAIPLGSRPGVSGTELLDPAEVELIRRWLAEPAEVAP